MEYVRWFLNGLLVITSLFLVLLILMHKGKGGGMSDISRHELDPAAAGRGSSGAGDHHSPVSAAPRWI